MPKFLIEVEHESNQLSCARAVEAFFKTGSHFFTHADWGCKDGEHKAWIVVEVDSKDDARALVPAVFRTDAKIVQLNSFKMDEIEDFLHSYK